MVERRRTWREVATAAVPESEGCVWTPVLDYLTPGRTYLLEVPQQPPPAGGAAEAQKWRPESPGNAPRTAPRRSTGAKACWFRAPRSGR